MAKKNQTYVTHDGIVAWRAAELLEAEVAEKSAARLARLPAIRDAWTDAVPQSEKRVVCWVPENPVALDKLQAQFEAEETLKALMEGPGMTWCRSRWPGVLVCHNPLSGCTYEVSRKPGKFWGWKFTCGCKRFWRAGTCKHVLTAIMYGYFKNEANLPLAGSTRLGVGRVDQKKLAALADLDFGR